MSGVVREGNITAVINRQNDATIASTGGKPESLPDPAL
jgi:hypothetical protein